MLKQQFNEQVRAYSTTYYQPAIRDTGDYRVLEQASALVHLHEKLDLKLSLDIAYDSRPPQTVKRTDIRYSIGMALTF